VVRLWDKQNKLLAESAAMGKAFTIAANQQSEIGELILPIAWTTLLPLMGISNITNLLSVFQKKGTKGMLQALKEPISMTVIMQIDGMSIQTPKTIINQ
jgi:hypothetical protein